jgi:hypothetical protein
MLASYCGICGKPFQSNDMFCAGCGAPRDDTNVSKTTLVFAPNAATVLSKTAPLGRPPQATEAAAVCELEIGDRSCGIQAVGRCATCGRAFCAQHKGLYQDAYSLLPSGWGSSLPRGFPSEAECVNLCVSCFEALRTKVAELPEVKHFVEVHDAEQYFISGAARTALLASGLPPVEIYQVTRFWETKRRGVLRRYDSEQVDYATPVGRGWILGTFKWGYRDKNSPSTEIYTPSLTALLDAESASLSFLHSSSLSFDSWSLLVPVSPYSPGGTRR